MNKEISHFFPEKYILTMCTQDILLLLLSAVVALLHGFGMTYITYLEYDSISRSQGSMTLLICYGIVSIVFFGVCIGAACCVTCNIKKTHRIKNEKEM